MQILDLIKPGYSVEVTTLASPERILSGEVVAVDLRGVILRLDGANGPTVLMHSAIETLTVTGGAR